MTGRTTKFFSPACLAVLLGLSLGSPSGAAADQRDSSPAKPNVLLIVADDLGFSDLGSYGGEIRTPNLDRLAAEGMRFTQFYNNAVCVVTRASLYTGASPRQGPGGLLRSNMVTLGEVMKAAGYATSLIGKWHLGEEAPQRPIDRGFDEYYGVLSGASNYFDPSIRDPEFYQVGEAAHRPFMHNRQFVTSFPPGYYTTDAYSEHAVKMIRQARETQRPFFINLCYNAPHFPLQAPAEDIARYRGRYHGGYQELREARYRRQVASGLIDPQVTKMADPDPKTSAYRYDYAISAWDQVDQATKAREEARMEVYAAMVDRMDQGIGRVLAALDESGQAKNTLIIFFSDNGGCASLPASENMEQYHALNRDRPIGGKESYEFVGPAWGWAQNAPFRRYKAWNHEGGICTPMIVRWPGQVAPGTIQRSVGHVIDILPTFLEISGESYGKVSAGKEVVPLEGQSLLPLLRDGAPRSRHDLLFWAYGGNRAVRDGDWKLVWGASDQRWELYDLKHDRTEANDLSGKWSERVRTMASAWESWARLTEVPGAK